MFLTLSLLYEEACPS
jgi:hypothetical protein